ncbi:MAG: hypothetical protein K8F91_05155 [Candidatus Obscuribacterales bacterium]|nr:hypothetical protein [Candidatus Obscuribacterales bacterium]
MSGEAGAANNDALDKPLAPTTSESSSEVAVAQWSDMKSVLGSGTASGAIRDSTISADRDLAIGDFSFYGGDQAQLGLTRPFAEVKVQNGAGTEQSEIQVQVDKAIDRGDSFKAQDVAQDMSGIRVDDPGDARLDQSGIVNTKAVLTNDGAEKTDRLRAGSTLYDNGITIVEDTSGKKYQILKSGSEGELSDVAIRARTNDGQMINIANGTVNKIGEVVQVGGNTRGIQLKDNETDGGAEQQDRQADVQDKPFEGKPIFDPKLTPEQKLKEADKMFQNGEKSFVGPDGKTYEISEADYGGRKVISIHTADESGRSKPVLRGIIERDGSVSKQRDSKGKEVDFVSDWGKSKGKDSALLKEPEPIPEPRPEPVPDPERGDRTKPDPEGGDRTNPDAGDRQSDSPEEQQRRLEAERETLRQNAEKIEPAEDREKFIQDMEAFELRARERNLPPSEVTDTYKQMNRLLSAENGAVGPNERQLAAKSFMHHAADPTNIDQGGHNTCNVTTLAERTMTRTPAKMAEMVATTALDGKWTASDGKQIVLRPQDLQPGLEEGTFPPPDNQRSYATQIMNLVSGNDVTQRRMPPQFYGQGRSTATNRTGETLTYADGSKVGNGKFNGVYAHEFTDVGRRLNGEDNFTIVHRDLNEGAGVRHVASEADLTRTLTEMRNGGKLPAVIQVDVNDPAFGGTGNPSTRGKWHVVSVTGFDPTTGRATISNQWGKANDKTISVADLYRSTRVK